MEKDNKTLKSFNSELEKIYQTIVDYVEHARTNIVKSVNVEQVIAYWKIGKLIVEKEQKGEIRAKYGEQLIKGLSRKLNKHFGKGFGTSNLAYMKQFYLAYSDRILHDPSGKSLQFDFNQNLSWTHYRTLMKEKRKEVRKFYEIETIKNHWSTPQLTRQMSSFLYERLAASKDGSNYT